MFLFWLKINACFFSNSLQCKSCTHIGANHPKFFSEFSLSPSFTNILPLLILLQEHWPSQCSSNKTDKILPWAFLLASLSAWKAFPQQLF